MNWRPVSFAFVLILPDFVCASSPMRNLRRLLSLYVAGQLSFTGNFGLAMEKADVSNNALVYSLTRQKWIACDLVSDAWIAYPDTYYKVESMRLWKILEEWQMVSSMAVTAQNMNLQRWWRQSPTRYIPFSIRHWVISCFHGPSTQSSGYCVLQNLPYKGFRSILNISESTRRWDGLSAPFKCG